MDTPVHVMQLQPRSSPTLVIGPHWPAEKFSDIWTPLITQINAFEFNHGLTRGTSPFLTATTQHTDEITELIQHRAITSVHELAPACGMQKAPMQQAQFRATTARQTLATKQFIRPQPSIAIHRIARALRTTTNHAYSPARSHELACQLKALARASTRAWINLHLADCPTRPGIDQVLQHLIAIIARYDAYICNTDNWPLSGARTGARSHA